MFRSINIPASRSLDLGLLPETKHLIYLSVAAALVILVPTLLWGIPAANDLSNHFRFALPFYDALRGGHLYPGWLAESSNGFGDPSFRFYPPALYYLLALMRAIFGNWYAASLLTFALISVLGSVGMYAWARQFTSSQTAMWAGIFYAFAPYHLNQLFQAVMLAEFAGASVLPFLFFFAERICRHRRLRDIAGLAAVYALLVLTHLPLAVIGSMALALYALCRLERTKLARTLGALCASVVIGLVASACYWVTMMAEVKWIHGNDFNPEAGINYRYNFVLSTFSTDNLNVWWMNILLAAGVAMFWPALALATRSARQREPQKRAIAAVVAVFSLTLLMTTPLSRPIWNLIHLLQETQFPWRWFTLTSMTASLLLALSIPHWTRWAKTSKRPLVILACGTIAISVFFSLWQTVRDNRALTPAQFDQTLRDVRGSESIRFWMPVWADNGYPRMNVPVDAGNRAVKVESWEPEKRTFQVSAGEATEARIKTFFYPHWIATAGGRVLPMRPDKQGAMLIALPAEAASVQLEFREPPKTRLARTASFGGWFLIAALLVPIRRRVAK